ncbi:carboxypeptidase regulatory-like domain-containing protein [Tepidibacter sp. Z1-5]|uniref:carboxypeptidase regulatory-like domain-containing protein n=1 Tax=Tepidibacter sp. Z1-5 TaxID=3134138 RepID=UPI0030BF6CE7
MKRKLNKITSVILIFNIIISLFIIFPKTSYAQYDDKNGDWSLEKAVKRDTDEAQLMIRAGDIDNFGFGWDLNFNPFSGKDTSVHSFPWATPNDEPDGLDKIMVVSGYDYNSRYKSTGVNRDGYTEKTSRNGNYVGRKKNKIYIKPNKVQSINLNYDNYLNGMVVRSAVLQMFVDDIQPGNAKGISGGNINYKVWLNDIEIPELQKIINALDQSGPRGKMITFKIPDRYLGLVSNGSLSVKIDDDRNGRTGDGYAIDFVKLLINFKEFSSTATIEGQVSDTNGNILAGAKVSAGEGIAIAFTDNDGRYRLEGIPAGQAQITAFKPGYRSQTIAKNVVVGGGYTNVNFRLKEITKLSTPTFRYTPQTPTNGNVTVTINYQDNPKIKEYRVGKDGLWQTYNGPVAITENNTIEARGKDVYEGYENESDIGRLEINNIDKTPPTATINYSTTDPTIESVIATLVPSENVTVTNNNGLLTYTFTENGSFTFEFRDIAGNTGTAIAVVNNINKNLPQVNIKVRDTSGVRDELDINSQNPYKTVNKKDLSIILQGDAYADINVKGEDVNFFEYQFIKTSEKPQDMPPDGWIDIDLNKETINEDVIKEKQGYLNKRSYDVSHMKAMQNESDWNKPDLVFKAPFDGTTYKPATYSSNSSEYGKWEEYTKKDGTKSKRWDTNSIFMNNMDVAWSSGNENLDYKEASKFWGYIKVPKDGEYGFGVKSDDGCKGYITVDGETTAFVDMLKVQSSTFGTKANKYNLKADKYYPIYLEYFNWGGRAQFEMVYSDNGLVNDSSQKVEANWFYPSKDNSPGEYTKTIFTGNKGVKFPSETGDYYIAFRTGKDGKVTREGIYGAFTVEAKTELTISKRIIEGDKVLENNDFTIEYIIEPPSEIPAIGTYKKDEEYKDKISLTNIQITDEYPEYVKNDFISGQKIIKYIPSIEYTKVIKNGETVYKYSGGSIKVEVNLSTTKPGNYVLSEDGKSKVTFTDFDGKANREQEFNPINITVVKRKQAEFKFDRTISKNNVEVDEKFEITYNIKPKDIENIDSSISNLSDENVINNITFTETLPEGIKIDKDNLPSGVTAIDNTITWNIGSITYKLSADKTKYVPSIEDKKFEIKVIASAEEEGTYNLENATIIYEDVDKSTVSKNIDEVDIITAESKVEITTGMFINGQFQLNNEIDLVKGFEIGLGAEIENVKNQDIVLEIQDKDKDTINISKDKVKIYEGIDENNIDFSNSLSNINITTEGKIIKIETSKIKQRKNYTVIYNVEALKDSSIGSAEVDIKVNSEKATHKIKIVPLPNLE